MSTLKGAALAGLGLSAFVGKSLAACGLFSLGAMYIAITPGKAGDLLRAVGSATWNSTSNAIQLCNKYNAIGSIQKVADRLIADKDGNVNVSSSFINHISIDERATSVNNSGTSDTSLYIMQPIEAEMSKASYEPINNLEKSDNVLLKTVADQMINDDITGIQDLITWANTTNIQDTGLYNNEPPEILDDESSKIAESYLAENLDESSNTMVPKMISIVSTELVDSHELLSAPDIHLSNVSLTDSIGYGHEKAMQSMPSKVAETTESFEISIKLKKKETRPTENIQERKKKVANKNTVESTNKLTKRVAKESSKDMDPISAGLNIHTTSMGTKYEKLTVPQLKDKLRNLGLKVTGVKAELLDRIHDYEGRSDTNR